MSGQARKKPSNNKTKAQPVPKTPAMLVCTYVSWKNKPHVVPDEPLLNHPPNNHTKPENISDLTDQFSPGIRI